MAASSFVIKEHVIESSYIRQYPRATGRGQEDVLQLCVKQYVPRNNLQPKPGDVTIIGAHANGFPKELYEPFYEDLLDQSRENDFAIRSIWIADCAWQGASGVLNEHILGDDPSWYDHSRDLLHLINTFRKEMPLPLVGIGHSLGAVQLSHLAILHPRLLTTLVLMEPVMYAVPEADHEFLESVGHGQNPAAASTKRRDLWPSRADAERAFRKQKFYQSWDSRVFTQWMTYGIRDTPTAVYPDEKGSVTLTCTKHQEVRSFMRPMAVDGKTAVDLPPAFLRLSDEERHRNFYRTEPRTVFLSLPSLRPTCLYIFGSASHMSTPALQQEKMLMTGVGVGGNGGSMKGRTQKIALDKIGHLVAMEAPKLCAEAAAPWLGQELRQWRDEQRVHNDWLRKPEIEKITIDENWKKHIGANLEKITSKL